MSLIKEFIERTWAGSTSISVVGDAMIDEYYDVQATRISPEFPIPVMRSLNDEPTDCLPGGAANVAYQFKHWNVSSSLFAWVDKEAAHCLDRNLDVNLGCIHLDLIGGKIPRKRRIYDGSHPAFRWDIEEPFCGLDDEKLASYQNYMFHTFLKKAATHPPKAVILSDYHKGTFATHTASNGKQARRQWIKPDYITVVDPKEGPVKGWEGCTIFKPNAKEAQELSGRKHWKDQAGELNRLLGFDSNIVITQGHHGVVGQTADGRFFEVPNRWGVDAKSVIGAGDCFVAFLTLAFSLGFPIDQAAEIAYQAGACYVRGNRNTPITAYDLMAIDDPIGAKFLPAPCLGDREFRMGFTNGCFDLLHAGHVESLRFARSLCDKLVVAVNDDESVRGLKGSNRPYVKLQDRMRMLAALDCVDFVVPFSGDTPLSLIRGYRPEVLVKGDEYRGKQVVGSEYAGEVAYCPMVEGLSTSSLEQVIWASAPSAAQEVSAS